MTWFYKWYIYISKLCLNYYDLFLKIVRVSSNDVDLYISKFYLKNNDLFLKISNLKASNFIIDIYISKLYIEIMTCS